MIEFLIKNNDLDNELSVKLLKTLIDKINKVNFQIKISSRKFQAMSLLKNRI